MLNKRESYLRLGEFAPQAMVDYLGEQESAALSEGCPGLRIVGEMTWALELKIGCEQLIEFEVLLNEFLPHSRTTAVCQYDRPRFDPSVIYDVLRTHPLVILGEQVCPNPFYETPRMVLGHVSAAERVDWKIAQLQQARSANQSNQQRHALLQAVVEGATDALFVKDRQGRYLLINSAGASIFGKAVEEVIGRDDQELFAPETAARIMEYDRRIRESGRMETYEHPGTAAGITRIWLTTTRPYRDEHGELLGVIGIARDVSENRRIERERDALWRRLRLQIDRLPLAYILLDSHFHVQDWNPAAEQTFGYSKSEAVGRLCFELINVLPLSACLQDVVHRIAAGEMQPHSVNDNRTKDGRTITCEWLNTPLMDTDGEFTGVIVLAQDITERQRRDESLRQHAEHLQMLSRRVVEVQEKERRHLARELHDEIGQVLSSLSVNLHVVSGGCGTTVRPYLDESIAIVGRAIQQVHNLSLDLRPLMLDDLGLISTLRSFADRQAQWAGFILDFAAKPIGRRLPPDVETASYRVVQEALTNVVRHAGAKRVWLHVEEREAEVELEIRDDGAGFDVARARERAIQGASLGVLGMQERVELLGGTIAIQSRPGHGTAIRARLPIE